MKSKLYSLLSVLGIAALLTACGQSNTDKVAPTSPPEQKLTAEQVLTKAEEKAKETKGQKWDATIDMTMKTPTDPNQKPDPLMPEELKVKGNILIEQVGSEKFYMKNKVSSSGGPISVQLEMDMYFVDQMIYLKENMTNEWLKAKAVDKDPFQLVQNIQADPTNAKYLAEMKKNLDQLKFQEEKNAYRFTAETTDPAQAVKLMNMLNPNEPWNEKEDGKLDKVSLYLTIDKKSFQVTEIGVEMNGNSEIEPGIPPMSMNMKMVSKYLGTIQDITPLPEEAKQAKEKKMTEVEKILEEIEGM